MSVDPLAATDELCFKDSATKNTASFKVKWGEGAPEVSFRGGPFSTLEEGQELTSREKDLVLAIRFLNGTNLVLTCSQGEGDVEFEMANRFWVRVGVGTEVLLSKRELPSTERKLWPLEIDVQRGASICLSMFDGAAIFLQRGSRLKMDAFREGAYVLSAQGRVKMRGADGRSLVLGEKHLPYAGGVLERGANGGLAKRSAAMDAELVFEPSGDIRWSMGGATGVVGENRSFRGVDGTLVELQPLAGGGAMVTIVKGLIHLSVEGAPGWRAIVQTGQRMEVRMDRLNQVVDFIGHGEWERPRLHLAGRHVVSVANDSLVQFKSLDSLSSQEFLLSSMGGNAVVVHADTGLETVVVGENRLFRAGRNSGETGRSSESGGSSMIRVFWRGETVVLEGELGTATTRIGEPARLVGSKGEELSAVQSSRTEITLESLRGGFLIEPRFAPGLTVDLPEGNLVVLTQPRIGTLVVKSHENSSRESNLSLRGSNQVIPALKPGGVFTFIAGGIGQEFGGLGGNTVFSEAAGAGPGGGASAPLRVPFVAGPINQPTSLDVTRLPQPSASGVGNE